ncbi:hypothetical protein CRUP_014071 [Coryphaenoides rupestris]|nr:hypothetical protein CRUP_014071 [Coryphaenoides rupestris]
MAVAVPTGRPTDGVDVYFEMPGDDSEHANFLRAKMDLEERRMKRINEVSRRTPAERDRVHQMVPTASNASFCIFLYL